MTEARPNLCRGAQALILAVLISRAGRRRRLGRLVDADEGGAEQAIVVEVSGLQHARHGAWRMAFVGQFEARFVAVWIELLTNRIKPAHTMLGERIK
jgi:hypothetical protein